MSGKIQIDQAILSKVGLLTGMSGGSSSRMWRDSTEIIGRQVFFPDVLGTIAAHHERHDGGGYPRALRGNELSLHAELAGLIPTCIAP